MQVVILAAGRGTRMGELTADTPKPLLEINGKTLLEYNLEAMPPDVDEVIIVIGYLGEKIRAKIGESFGRVKITYVEQKEQKGTADALWACQSKLHDRFLVIAGDDIYARSDLEKLVKEPLAILVSEMKSDDFDNRSAAMVKIDANGNLEDIVERLSITKGTVVNTGAYVLDARIFDYPMKSAGIPANEFGLPQTMLQMVGDDVRFTVVRAEKWHKVVSPEDLKL